MKLGYWGSATGFEFLQDLGVPVQTFDPTEPEQSFDRVIVDPDLSPQALENFPQGISDAVRQTGFVDSLEYVKRRYVLYNVLRAHVLEIIIKNRSSLNVQQKVYIAGHGPWASFFALVAFQMGFRSFVLVSQQTGDAGLLTERLAKFCFGAKFEELYHSDLTLQPNNGSLLVNTIGPEESTEVMSDLAYLNYLSPQGLVIETHATLGMTVLSEEAFGSKIPVISAAQMRAFVEYVQLRKIETIKFNESADSFAEKREVYFSTRNSPSV